MIKFDLKKKKLVLKNLLDSYSKKIGLDLNYIFINSFWVSLNQVVFVTLSLILTIFLARFTSREVFGSYNFILSFIEILTIISMPGFSISLLKAVAKGKDGLYEETFRIRFFWSLLGVPLLIVIGLYYFYFVSQLIGIGLLLASIFFPVFKASQDWMRLLEGKKKFDMQSKYSIILISIKTTTIILATLLGRGNLITILIAFLVTNSFINLFFYYKSKRFLENQKIEKNWKKNAYKLSFVQFTLRIYNNLDKIIIGTILGPGPLAIYVIAANITYQIIGSTNEIFKIFVPKIFNMDAGLIIDNLKKFVPKFLLLSYALVIILILVLPILIPFLFSVNYLDSVFYAQIFSLIIPLNILTNLTNNVFISLNQENMLLKFRIIGTIIILVLYLTLIPLLGILGAVISSIIYYLILMLIQFYYILR